DGDACTLFDQCQGGICASAGSVLCTPQDPCHAAGVCDPATGVCSNPTAANGTSCSDGNVCTQSDTCQNGICTGSNPITCIAQDQCHAAGTCDTSTGACSNPVKTDGTGCDDANPCTQSDACQAGICTGTNPVACAA